MPGFAGLPGELGALDGRAEAEGDRGGPHVWNDVPPGRPQRRFCGGATLPRRRRLVPVQPPTGPNS